MGRFLTSRSISIWTCKHVFCSSWVLMHQDYMYKLINLKFSSIQYILLATLLTCYLDKALAAREPMSTRHYICMRTDSVSNMPCYTPDMFTHWKDYPISFRMRNISLLMARVGGEEVGLLYRLGFKCKKIRENKIPC